MTGEVQPDTGPDLDIMPVEDAVEQLAGLALAGPRLHAYRRALRASGIDAPERAGEREVLAERLKAEADRHWRIDPHISLRLARAIILAGRLRDEDPIVGLGLMARADAVRLLGEPRLALRFLATAAMVFRRCGDEVGWARTRISAMGALISVGRLPEALDVALEARAVLEAHDDRARLVRLDLNTALVYDKLGRHADALQLWDEVVLMCRDPAIPGASELANTASLNRAVTLHRLGRLTDSLSALREVRAAFEAGREQLAVANVDWLIGFVLLFQGRYGPALRAFEDARLAFEAMDVPVDAARVGCEILECYLATGQPDRVVALADSYTATMDRHGLTLVGVEIALHHAEALRRLGRFADALAVLDAAEARLDSAGLEVWRAHCAYRRAQILLAQGTPAALAMAGDALDLALAEFKAQNLPVDTARALLLDAQLLLAAGRRTDAQAAAQRALDSSASLGLPGQLIDAYALLADLAVDGGDLDAASGAYARAIGELEQMQRYMTIDLRRSFLSADPARIFDSAIALALRRDRPEEVLDLVERAKSRALLDHVDGGIDIRPRDFDPISQGLLAELQATREHYRLYHAALGERGKEQPESLFPDLDIQDLVARSRRCEERMRELLESLHLRNPAYDEQAAIWGSGIGDPRPYLEPDRVVVSYYAMGDDVLILTLAGGTVTTTVVPGAWPAVCTDLGLLQLNLDAVTATVAGAMPGELPRLEARARAILQRLWNRLLAPIHGALRGAARLTIAPYGRLHHLPFQALHDGDCYLIERIPVSIAPSASVLAALHRRTARQGTSHERNGTPLLVGNTQHGRLQHVVDEIQAISRRLPGHILLDEEASAAAVLGRVGQASVLHLATHGVARPDDPLFSFVQLADMPLTTADIMTLKLEASLVTLSACETALGSPGGGDDLAGLSRAFLYAGAEALILSLWRVEDRSTARLMDALYAGLAAGLTKDEALRSAQLALLRATAGPDSGTLGHPYFWAPFVLIGHNGSVVGQ